MSVLPLVLDPADPRVLAARRAETKLFDGYGLQPVETIVPLPGQGLRVRVLSWGEGEPLVVVPGNTGDVFPLASLLAQFTDRRIIAINRPGGGLSEGFDHATVDIPRFIVSTLETVFAAMGLTEADVMAHSMGAHWSLLLATERPHLVRRLALLGNPGNVMGGQPPLLLRLVMGSPVSRLLLGVLAKNESSALRLLRGMGHSQATLDAQPSAFGESYAAFRQLPHYAVSLTSLLGNLPPKLGVAELSRVPQPTLLVLGDKDTFATVDTGRAIVAALPKGELYIVPGAGHLPWLESPKTCGNAVRSFLRG